MVAKDLMPKVGDWVQVYMWQAAKPFEYLAWQGEKVQVVKRLKKVEKGTPIISAIVSHPEWLEPLKSEGVEVPIEFVCFAASMPIVGEPQTLTAPADPGDRVVVAAGPYERWYMERRATLPYTLNGTFKNYSQANREWLERYAVDAFPCAAIFTFRQSMGDMALIVADGERYKVPILCLQVLPAQKAIASEVQAA